MGRSRPTSELLSSETEIASQIASAASYRREDSFTCLRGLVNRKPNIYKCPTAAVHAMSAGHPLHRIMLSIDAAGDSISQILGTFSRFSEDFLGREREGGSLGDPPGP